MKIVLSSDGSVELSRGEKITRGQDKSRYVYVEWKEDEAPLDTGQITADNLAVQICITRPDGEQSGWYSMFKVDAEIKYYYILQAWDTAVSGESTAQIRWFDISLDEEDRSVYTSAEMYFIVDNGKIAQPLNLSAENYNDIVMQFLTPLANQAFRKYNVNALPTTIIYNADGTKTAPALYYNFTHNVSDITPSAQNQGATYNRTTNSRNGFILVDKRDSEQLEIFFTTVGKIYTRTIGATATEFKDIFEAYSIKNVEQQSSINSLLTAIVQKINYDDIIDSLESLDIRRPLSAKQGNVLHNLIIDTNRRVDLFAEFGLDAEGYYALTAEQAETAKHYTKGGKIDKKFRDIDINNGCSLEMLLDTTNYHLTVKLKNRKGVVISSGFVDLPIESLITNASYSNKILTLTFQSGQTLNVNISDIISGLVPETRKINGKTLNADLTLTADDVGAYPKGQTYTKEQTDTAINNAKQMLQIQIDNLSGGVFYAVEAEQAKGYSKGGKIDKELRKIDEKHVVGLDVEIDEDTHKLTITLKNKKGAVINSAVVDLPLSMFETAESSSADDTPVIYTMEAEQAKGYTKGGAIDKALKNLKKRVETLENN